jgi:hypothetical protein
MDQGNVMRNVRRALVIALTFAGLLAGCEAMRNDVSSLEECEIRSAAREFADAMGTGDAARLRDTTVVDADAQSLGNKVIEDAVAGRRMELKLAACFGYEEHQPGVVGGEAWLSQFATTAENAPIKRAGMRVRLGPPGEFGDVFLRHVGDRGGVWKVELIPTLVVEAAGKSKLDVPAVEYRLGVNRALNEWMLARLANNEFKSKAEFDLARRVFWMHYLTYITAGKDPHTEMMPSLPELPHDLSAADDW